MRYVIATISLWCWKKISYNDVTLISKHNRSISRSKSNKKPMSLQYRVPIGVASNYGAEIFWITSVFVSSVCFIHNFLKSHFYIAGECWALREKCPNTEYFLVRIFRENTDQKILRIWTLFTQWRLFCLPHFCLLFVEIVVIICYKSRRKKN